MSTRYSPLASDEPPTPSGSGELGVARPGASTTRQTVEVAEARAAGGRTDAAQIDEAQRSGEHQEPGAVAGV